MMNHNTPIRFKPPLILRRMMQKVNAKLFIRLSILVGVCLLGGLSAGGLQGTAQAASPNPHATNNVLFQTSDRCVACHNGMISVTGEEVSIGTDWSTSLMANSSRDPYWQASVRRETMDHPEAQAAIEDECSVCHMPITRFKAKSQGLSGQVFTHLPLHEHHSKEASDGVTCSVCHQIAADNLGMPSSYNGNFVIAPGDAKQAHAEYGPYDVSAELQQVMRTSTEGLQPEAAGHIRTSELCASCHTLITEARDAQGTVIGKLPEQMPYQEWLHSDFKTERTCQSCHMPAVGADTPITRILGANRSGVARHQFVGANFVMQRMLGHYHDELDVAASSQEMAEAANRTLRYLQSQAATIRVTPPTIINGRLETDITVVNLGGHKLPTAYPARRAWLHVMVRDANHRIVFESGALNADGSIVGNDNDSDATKYEPHYTLIRSADQVQIYESILQDHNGRVTTGLLSAVDYAKDNRLLPRGFDKAHAPAEIAVHGGAALDDNFTDRGDKVHYSIDVAHGAGPYQVEAALWYQPIGFRWANNFKPYTAREPQQFTAYYDAMSQGNAVTLASASATSTVIAASSKNLQKTTRSAN